MKKILSFAIIILIFFYLINPSLAYAHTEFTNVQYSDSNGWVIKEYGSYHSADNYISYTYNDDSFTNMVDNLGNPISGSHLKTAFEAAKDIWKSKNFNGTYFNFQNDSYGTFKIKAVFDKYSSTVASVDNANAEVIGYEPDHYHYSSCNIILNAYHMTTSRTDNVSVCVHELGHAIGLLDTYTRSDVMMYGYADYTKLGLNEPTQHDINGAAVILGIHRNVDHIFSFEKIMDSSGITNSIQHIDICDLCDGYKYEEHNFEPSGLASHYMKCTKCLYELPCSYIATWSPWTNIASDEKCRVREMKCSAGHVVSSEIDYTHNISSGSNICSDCGFDGTNIVSA